MTSGKSPNLSEPGFLVAETVARPEGLTSRWPVLSWRALREMWWPGVLVEDGAQDGSKDRPSPGGALLWEDAVLFPLSPHTGWGGTCVRHCVPVRCPPLAG